MQQLHRRLIQLLARHPFLLRVAPRHCNLSLSRRHVVSATRTSLRHSSRITVERWCRSRRAIAFWLEPCRRSWIVARSSMLKFRCGMGQHLTGEVRCCLSSGYRPVYQQNRTGFVRAFWGSCLLSTRAIQLSSHTSRHQCQTESQLSSVSSPSSPSHSQTWPSTSTA